MRRDALLPAREVKQKAHANPSSQWPRPRSDRWADLIEGQLAAPAIEPSFQLEPGETVFTLGSCFTRAIEDELHALGFDVPCHSYAVPEAERSAPRPNSVLNQYVPPVMLQELKRAVADDAAESARCLVDDTDGQVVDMQLFARPAVSRSRGHERRAEVEALFRRAFESDVAVITLGQTEAWWDDEAKLFCNQLPPGGVLDRSPNRFYFHALELDEIVDAVSESCDLLLGQGSVTRILLTVSPVPISRAWGVHDALASYVYSKSLLRVASEHVARSFADVDYFPSFDMVMLSDRSRVFSPDRMHLRDPIAHAVVGRMIDAYVQR